MIHQASSCKADSDMSSIEQKHLQETSCIISHNRSIYIGRTFTTRGQVNARQRQFLSKSDQIVSNSVDEQIGRFQAYLLLYASRKTQRGTKEENAICHESNKWQRASLSSLDSSNSVPWRDQDEALHKYSLWCCTNSKRLEHRQHFTVWSSHVGLVFHDRTGTRLLLRCARKRWNAWFRAGQQASRWVM